MIETKKDYTRYQQLLRCRPALNQKRRYTYIYVYTKTINSDLEMVYNLLFGTKKELILTVGS